MLKSLQSQHRAEERAQQLVEMFGTVSVLTKAGEKAEFQGMGCSRCHMRGPAGYVLRGPHSGGRPTLQGLL